MGPDDQGPETLLGQSIGGYQLDRVLGVGATGAVYLGSRLDDTPKQIEREGRPLVALPDVAAIKLLFVPWQLSATQAGDFRARFLREAETLSELNHPHILQVLTSGQDAATGRLYMVLPHVERTLVDRIGAVERGLPLDETAAMLDQLASALDYAHSQGVVHRDVKPANILLDAEGNVFLADFGILRLLDASRTKLTTTGGVVGTPDYMAPEQVRGEPSGPAADRYSLAVVAYEMVTGRTPFAGESLATILVRQLQDTPPAPHVYREDLPEPAEAAILKGLSKEPTDRFAMSAQFAEAFRSGIGGVWSPLVARATNGPAPRRETAPPPAFLPGQPRSAPEPVSRSPLAEPDGVPAPLPRPSGARGASAAQGPWVFGSGAGEATEPDMLAGAHANPTASAQRSANRRTTLWATLAAAVVVLVIAGLLVGGAGSGLGFALGASRATATSTNSQRAFGSGGTATGQPSATKGGSHQPTHGGGGGGGTGGNPTNAPTTRPGPGATATPTPTATATPTPTATATPTPRPTPTNTPPPPPSQTIQIGWSSAHPTWIWMQFNGFPPATYTYSCNFSTPPQSFKYTVVETTEPEYWDNGHTCYDTQAGDHVWVIVNGVWSNTLTVP